MAEITITKENFEAEVLQSQTPVVVDFWATWCGPCQMIAPEVEALAEAHEGSLKVAKLNIDEEMELALKFGVMSIPTIMLFKDGEVVQKAVGYRKKAELEEVFGL